MNLLAETGNNLSQAFTIQTVGVCVVFGALATLWLIVAAVGKAFTLKPKTPAPPPAGQPAAPQPAAGQPAADAEDPDLIAAVIAAAVAVTLGQNARVVHFAPTDPTSLLWTMEGRSQLYASHTTR
ncbi:MAG: OadG family protein [Opitutaceae bacterium]|jgi:sodium pump decarboxylase gamma subunit|nr:OadG family protein [Opitutaceae bacterium]